MKHSINSISLVNLINSFDRTVRDLAALVLVLLALSAAPAGAVSSDAVFRDGAQAYHAGEYSQAAKTFAQSAALQPAAGTLQNLGNAEWQRGRVGPAIVAWEQSLWLDPFGDKARNNLRLARKTAQVQAPDLTWYEAVSTWLPANWWAWIAGLSLWLAVAMVMLPGILRRRRSAWQQAVAAFSLTIFLLSVPAHAGVYTRSRLGFVLDKSTPLLLTPTQDAQIVTRLGAGEPARCQRVRGNFMFIRTVSDSARGWIDRSQFGLVCGGK